MLAARREALANVLGVLDADEREVFEAVVAKLLARLTSDRESAYQICRLCDQPCCQREGCPVDQAASGT
jgi:hypothetical protein